VSIVIAKIIGDYFDIRSDSRVTDPNLVKGDMLTGILKSVIINENLCISFAGGVLDAQNALKFILQKQFVDINNIIGYLLKINRETDFGTEFIISYITISTKDIIKISNGVIENNLRTAWIGDYEAFRLFQEQMILNETSTNLTQQQKINNAFEYVLKNGNIETVGDYHIQIGSPKNKFEYCIRLELTAGPQNFFGVGGRISFGTAMNGSFGMSYLTSNKEKEYAIGVHFTHGNFGVLLYPMVSLSPIIIENCNGQAFINRVYEKFNITIGGFILT
jgi:hypothetical protein